MQYQLAPTAKPFCRFCHHSEYLMSSNCATMRPNTQFGQFLIIFVVEYFVVAAVECWVLSDEWVLVKFTCFELQNVSRTMSKYCLSIPDSLAMCCSVRVPIENENDIGIAGGGQKTNLLTSTIIILLWGRLHISDCISLRISTATLIWSTEKQRKGQKR